MIKDGQFEQAIPLLSGLLKAAPGTPALLMNLGLALHMAGHDAEAVAQLGQLLKLQPAAYPAIVMSAVSYMRLNQPAKAVPLFEKALTQKPDDQEARRMLSDALLMLGRYDGAVVQLRKLSVALPQDPKTWYGLGRAYELLAQQAYEKLTKLAPTSSYALLLAAETRLKQKKYTSAFGLFKEAESKQPVLPGVHAGLAEVYEHTGHKDWAAVEREKEKSVKPPPDRPATQASALFAQARRNNAQALDAFRKLASLPPSSELFEVVAELQRNQGQFAESLQSWNEALKLTPGDPRLQREIATTVYLSHEYRKAEPLLRAELTRDPTSPEVNFMLGDTLLNQQKPAEAIPFLEKTVAADPTYLPAQSALARSYGQSGEPAKAIPHLEAALPVDSDGALHYQLARAYQAAGRAEEAKKLLARYQELQKLAGESEDKGEVTAPAP